MDTSLPIIRPSHHVTRVLHLFLLSALIFVQAGAAAQTDEVVGTWKKADNTLLEFKRDGSICIGAQQVGRWERLRDSNQPIMRLNGVRDYCYISLGAYKRTLTVKTFSTSVTSTVRRMDGGPTFNPDVPNEHAAMELEFNDLVLGIERTNAALDAALGEAAEARHKHLVARSIGRISGWIPVAQKWEAQAQGLEGSLRGQRERLQNLAGRLGKSVPVVAERPRPSGPVGAPQGGGFQPGYPMAGVTVPQQGSRSRDRGNHPPSGPVGPPQGGGFQPQYPPTGGFVPLQGGGFQPITVPTLMR